MPSPSTPPFAHNDNPHTPGPLLRRERRIAVNWPVAVRTSDDRCHQCWTKDISSAGVCLQGESLKGIVEGRDSGALKLSMQFYLPDEQLPVEVEAKLVWETCGNGKGVSGWLYTARSTSWGLLQEKVGEHLEPLNARDERTRSWHEEEEVELMDYLNVLVKRRWLFILGTALCALAALLYSFTEAESFVATAKILPVEYLKLPGAEIQATSIPYLPLLASIPLNKRVLQRAYTFTSGDTIVTQSLQDHLHLDNREIMTGVRVLLGMADFEQSRDRIIEIRVETTEFQLAAQVANGYIEELKSYELEKLNESTQRDFDFVSSRMDELQQELKKAQTQLDAFKEGNRHLLLDAIKEGNRHLLVEGSEDVFTSSALATELSQLEQEAALKQSLFLTVANQRELLRLQGKKETPGFEVISWAEPPPFSPYSPIKPLLIGGMVGAVLSAFLAFIMEYLAKKGATGELEPVRAAWRQDRERIRRIFRV